MGIVFNFCYLLAIVFISPWLIYKAMTTGKYRRGMGTKFLGRVEHALLEEYRKQRRPIVWFHGVSVGEVHLLRQVVARFRQRRPDCGCVISTTTDTGYDEARKCFGDLPVILWPLDFTWAVGRALRTIRPALVVLAEGELWPNFLRAAQKQGVPVATINARMSPRTWGRFRKVRWLASRLFGRIAAIGAQTSEYAEYYRVLGGCNVLVTGNVKYDGAQCDRNNVETLALRGLLGLGERDLIWVAGSTQAPEEFQVLEIYRRLRATERRLRLVLVPRQKDRFDQVARLLRESGLPFVRRTELTGTPRNDAIILVDKIGELRALWGLADVAFVGGSLDGKRGGQNMIEPAAYGAAVLFGPHTWNFKEPVKQLLAHQAALQVEDARQLEFEVERLLGDGALRVRLGAAAQRFVLSQQGATERTVAMLDGLLVRGAARAA